VFVDGITRAGKSLMGPVLQSFDRVEIERMEEIFEYVGALYRLGKIERDAAVTTLQLRADAFLYNGLLGRNMNLRFGDHSSVWQQTQQLDNLRRLRLSEGPEVVDRIASGKPIFQNMTHDQLANFNLHHEAFGSDLYFVEIVRNPIALVESWIKRGWGTRFENDPLALTYTLEHGDTQVPYYAAGWEDKFVAASPEGRVIRMIYQVWSDIEGTYKSLSDKEKSQVHYVMYDEFIRNPKPYMDPLASFLGTTTTKHTKSILKRKNLPANRPVDNERIKNKIGKKVSAEETEMMERLESEYNQLLQIHSLA
jgi:hypothetical protein